MKLSDWAKKNGISYLTAYRWFKSDKLPVKSMRTKSGTILVEENIKNENNKKVYIYSRVSSSNKKEDLDRQVERCIIFANSRGYEIVKIYKEIASGMNDNRKKLFELFNQNPQIIIVEYKDRLTRFGFNYLEYFLNKTNCELIVINRYSVEENDLIKDLISIITSFCCRLYGMRKGNNKATKIKKEIINDKVI